MCVAPIPFNENANIKSMAIATFDDPQSTAEHNEHELSKGSRVHRHSVASIGKAAMRHQVDSIVQGVNASVAEGHIENTRM